MYEFGGRGMSLSLPRLLILGKIVGKISVYVWARGTVALICTAASIGGFCVGGCATEQAASAARMDRGLVLVLPGYLVAPGGDQPIRTGLVQGGVPYAVAVLARPTVGDGPLRRVSGLVDPTEWSRRASDRLLRYQADHPGRPVFLIGHRDGAMAALRSLDLLGAEAGSRASPSGALAGKHPRRVSATGVILLSPDVSSRYDLTASLACCDRGIVNFHGPWAPRSSSGCILHGTSITGDFVPSAGREGFSRPYRKLYQVKATPAMLGGGRPFLGTGSVPFARVYVAPWIIKGTWPVCREQRAAKEGR